MLWRAWITSETISKMLLRHCGCRRKVTKIMSDKTIRRVPTHVAARYLTVHAVVILVERVFVWNPGQRLALSPTFHRGTPFSCFFGYFLHFANPLISAHLKGWTKFPSKLPLVQISRFVAVYPASLPTVTPSRGKSGLYVSEIQETDHGTSYIIPFFSQEGRGGEVFVSRSS